MDIIDRVSSAKQHLQKKEEEQRQKELQEKREEQRLEELKNNVRVALERISHHLELVRGGYDNDERWEGKDDIIVEESDDAQKTFALHATGLEYELMSVKVGIREPSYFEEKTTDRSQESTETLLKLNFKSDNTKLFLPEEMRDGTYENRASTVNPKTFREIGALVEEILYLLAPSCSEESIEKAVKNTL